MTTARGRTTTRDVALFPDDHRELSTTQPDGTVSSRKEYPGSSSTEVTVPDGTRVQTSRGPDPRFGMAAPTSGQTLTLPSGLTRTEAESRTATLAQASNPLSATALGRTLAVNGRAWSSNWDAPTRKTTYYLSPAGRTAATTLDAQGRVERVELPGVPAVVATYDANGRPEWLTQGARSYHVEYDAAGYPWRLTDPLSRQVTLEYDLAGRVWRQTLPGNRQVVFGHDPNGNLSSLTPPGRPAHGFGYWPGDAMKSYDPPAATAGGPLWPTGYAYDLDGALTSVSLPDGASIVPAYEPATGRLASVTTAQEVTSVGYDPQGRVSAVTTPSQGLGYGYDGFLLTSESYTGTVAGSVSWTYDNDFRPATQSVNGTSLSFGYDADSLLISTGALAIGREAATGRISGTTLSTVATTQSYTSYGEPWVTTARVSGSAVYSYALARDLSGRVTGKTETIGGSTTDYVYGFDTSGRLETVTRNGTLVATYGYDENGNRWTKTTPSGTESGSYDLQDRLLSYGGASYTWKAPGALESKTTAAGTTWYDYDGLGALLAVLLPTGTRIDYVVDGLGRRIGKKVNGVLVEGFLYEGKLRPVAWLDGAGQVKARFVYGTRINVPEYMVTTSGTYRILTDHLGSPRLVVDATTGAIAQRMDYDEWGQVLLDTNPGFQPFGFAGGLHDRDTGLVRFGARDYDPSTGRWTGKDPLLFDGGDTNLYLYVGGDPVNFVDPRGLCFKDAFMRNFNFNVKATNHFFFSFPTSLARTGVGILTAGATAETFGTVTPWQAIKSILWPGLGPRGIATLGGVGGTVGAAALNTAINAAAVTAALEAGILIGSAADALGQALADDSPCRDSCGAK